MPPDMTSQSHQEESEYPFSQPKPVRRPTTISLSDEQKAILELVMQKKNVFYTGSAGMSEITVLGLLSSIPISAYNLLPSTSEEG